MTFEIREYVEAGRSAFGELRIDYGPGYRVYFGRDGKTLVILLGRGTKRRQGADIQAALERWQRYKKAKVQNGSDA